MANQPSFKKNGMSGTINGYIAGLYLNSNYSDVTILIKNERIHAHKNVLGRCDYFQALFLGGLAESTKKEIRLEVDLVAFKQILRYIYYDNLSLESISTKTIINTLQLADMYNLELPAIILEHLTKMLTVDTVCNILELTRVIYYEPLMDACYVCVDRCAREFLQHPSFQDLSQVSF